MPRFGRNIVFVMAALTLGTLVLLAALWKHAHDLNRPSVSDQPPTHGFLGIDFGGSRDAPLTVHRALAGTGAAEAQLQPGDMIMSIGNVTEPNYEAVQSVLGSTRPGDELPLIIRRDDGEFSVNIRLISFDEAVAASREAHADMPPP